MNLPSVDDVKNNAYDGYKLPRGKLNPFQPFDLWAEMVEYMQRIDKDRCLHMPTLILYITWKYRYSVDSVRSHVEKVWGRGYDKRYSKQRTNAIFVTKRTRGGRVEKRRARIFPIHQHAFISHIVVRAEYVPDF